MVGIFSATNLLVILMTFITFFVLQDLLAVPVDNL